MRWAALGGAASLLLAGCAFQHESPATARFTDGGVEVTISVSQSRLKAIYRPIRPGFHIYSLDLPSGGVQGLGVPTRIGVRGGLRATGIATADRPVRSLALPSLGVELPVYPDGPVTISLPIRRTGRAADVVVSYGACSSGTCLAPVTDHVTRVALQ
ncbi:hypothetical protein [Actinomadura roseirufa]|uniref:hypothetical protein n=1 Tax=Actinomadura roseirufa TaxID=2094049 RepID=UPI0010417952|nr:hypothetical protein [Actinomadura roseirufa]